MLVRRELLADIDGIDEVHRQAFAADTEVEPLEVGLVHLLRADPGWVPALSLVAEDAAGDVVGHVVCTKGALAGTVVLGLGPIGVLPARQRTGVGQALMHAVLGAADALDYPLVALLGHMDYYPQFGFRPAGALGIVAPDPNWGDHFQVRALTGWHEGLRGTFRYAAPFETL